MKGKRSVIAVLLMLIMSWISYKGYDINFFQPLKPAIKDTIYFFLLILVALSGLYVISFFPEKWLMFIWIFAYSAVVSILICIGIVDVLHRITNIPVRNAIASFRLFFTSPLPFLILLFLKKTVNKNIIKTLE